MAPDLLAFGPFYVAQWGNTNWRVFPEYVHQSYSVTHSLVIWGLLTAAFWYGLGRFPTILSAWGLHILFDIPLHELSFFPTPYLWPFTTPLVNGLRWAQPVVLIPNYIALIIAYTLMIGLRYRRERAALRHKTVGANDAIR
jgi:hypothetical protein